MQLISVFLFLFPLSDVSDNAVAHEQNYSINALLVRGCELCVPTYPHKRGQMILLQQYNDHTDMYLHLTSVFNYGC